MRSPIGSEQLRSACCILSPLKLCVQKKRDWWQFRCCLRSLRKFLNRKTLILSLSGSFLAVKFCVSIAKCAQQSEERGERQVWLAGKVFACRRATSWKSKQKNFMQSRNSIAYQTKCQQFRYPHGTWFMTEFSGKIFSDADWMISATAISGKTFQLVWLMSHQWLPVEVPLCAYLLISRICKFNFYVHVHPKKIRKRIHAREAPRMSTRRDTSTSINCNEIFFVF